MRRNKSINNIKCPHCNTMQSGENEYCEYCLGLLRESKKYLFEMQQLKIAMRVNNINKIELLSKSLIDVEEDNDYIKYAYAYIQAINKDYIFINKFLENASPVNDIVFHMILHKEIIGIDNVKKYINLFNDRIKQYCFMALNDEIFDNDIESKLVANINFPKKDIPNHYLSNGTTLICVGIILEILIFLLVVIHLNETRYFSNILLFIFPSILVGMGITRLVLKKGNKFLSIVFALIALIITTYITLISYQNGFLDHIVRVIKAPYELIKFILKFFIKIE